ncbi:MAG: cold shock domain-containing protein [Syntrophales bacterium]|jgi:CspA family cold shock protein|nr:cold shock domain-containing protein [Syntrophales bacterium]
MGDREAGVVKWFNDKKGYGFISRQSGGDIFVHHSSIVAEGFRTLKEGDQVEFEVKEDAKGKSAVEVKKV